MKYISCKENTVSKNIETLDGFPSLRIQQPTLEGETKKSQDSSQGQAGQKVLLSNILVKSSVCDGVD